MINQIVTSELISPRGLMQLEATSIPNEMVADFLGLPDSDVLDLRALFRLVDSIVPDAKIATIDFGDPVAFCNALVKANEMVVLRRKRPPFEQVVSRMRRLNEEWRSDLAIAEAQKLEDRLDVLDPTRTQVRPRAEPRTLTFAGQQDLDDLLGAIREAPFIATINSPVQLETLTNGAATAVGVAHGAVYWMQPGSGVMGLVAAAGTIVGLKVSISLAAVAGQLIQTTGNEVNEILTEKFAAKKKERKRGKK